MHATVTNLLESYGYIFLFIVVGAESMGIPVPGETVLVSAAAYAALGHLDIYTVVLTAAAAAILGDTGGYWIGHRGGVAAIHRWGRMLHINESHIALAHKFFERHGGKTVFIGRFVAILRTWAAVLAGVARMPYRTFLFYNATGGILWAGLFGTLGYIFGRNLPKLDHLIGQASLAVVLLVALVVILIIAMRWFRANTDNIAESSSTAWQRAAHSRATEGFGRRHPRMWNFISDRFARGEYLGLHLTLGLVASLGALWLFGAITEDVIHHDPLTQLDVLMLDWFRAHASPSGDAVMSAISLIGSPAAVALIAVAVGVVLVTRRNWIVFGGWAAAFAGGAVLDWSLKHIIQRPRPPGASMFMHQFSYSFPSEHAMGSTVGYGMLAYLLVTFWAVRNSSRIAIVTATVVLLLSVGLGRLYLGVHYFSDVIGGYAAGAVWLVACMSGVEIARRQPHTSRD